MAAIQSLEATQTFCFKLILCEVKIHPSLLKAMKAID